MPEKDQRIVLKVSKSEKEKAQQNANDLGLSLAGYIRYLIATSTK